MKKIININLSGRVIPIEDSAYEKLQAYIESLRRYFANEEGRDEIINDIESRIAELMNDKVRKGAPAVTEADVQEIIESMGRPEDFDAEEKAEAASSQSYQKTQEENFSSRKSRGRLYRDSSDKFIAGVCSGIANYINADPAIVRIIFAIITFGGFGLGFLVYLLLWVVLPTKDLDGFSGKRLYRNPDDRIIGGVAGGLAAYFNIRTSTLRLIMAAPLILSMLFGMLDWWSWRHDFDFFPNIIFGSLSGTVFLAYLVLWIVLPEARGPYEKMEMRGEKVDVNSIRQNVKEGMDNMKDRAKSFSEEVKQSAENFSARAKEFAGNQGKTFATEVGSVARRSGTGLGHAIGVIFRVFFLFIAGTIAFGLFVGLMALLFSGVAWWPINNFLWTSKWQQLYAWGTLIFFLIIPLVALIIWVIRRVMGVRSRSSYLGWTFGFLWTIGWVSAALLTVSVTKDFRYSNVNDYNSASNTVVAVNQPAGGRMVVAVSQPELQYSGNFGWINDEATGWDLSNDSLKLSFVKFAINKSIDNNYHVIVHRYSSGRNRAEARDRAQKISYHVSSYDSILDLANSYAIDKESKFRLQHVEVEIQVPVGKKINFDHTVIEKLNPAEFSRRRKETVTINGRTVRRRYYDDYSFRFRTGEDYTMGADGKMRDTKGNVLTWYYDNDDRYDHHYDQSEDTNDVRQQLEEEKRRKEESDRRIKELEKKQNELKGIRDSVKSESMDDKSDETASAGNPSLFSLVKWM